MSAFGLHSCILIGDTVHQYKKEVIRSSMGSIFSVKIVNCSLENFNSWIKNNYINLYGTDLKSKYNYLNETWKFPVCLALGNEKSGISKDLESLCHRLVKIETVNNESINLSVASSIMISEIIRKNPK